MDFAQIQAEYEARFIVCSRCGKNTGNAHQGHYWQFCKVLRKMADEFHLCCPGDCELYEQDGTRKPLATSAPDRREALQRRVDEARADFLGRRVREVSVEWASRQPNPKPSHLTPWDQLDEGNREVDRLIGTALAAEGYREANNAITWGTTCLNDARLLDACYEADMRREAAEKALAEAERRHEALLTQAEDYVREISEARGQERAVLADLIALASSRNGPNRRERLERARAVLGESGNA